MKDGSLRFGIAAGLMLATALALQAHSHSEFFPPRASLSSLPSQMDGWIGTDETLDQATLEILGPGEFLLRNYDHASPPEPWINLYLAYFPTQRSGDTIHSPNHCLPGAGWIPTSREVIQITRPTALPSPPTDTWFRNRWTANWCCTGFRRMAALWPASTQAKYYLVSDSIRMNRSDGALVRLMTPMLKGESADAAQARMMKLGSQILPLLDNYIPR